mmetsp:Transcript_82277/g.172269  ORF Transcript_82277/g.172269 Transcript_82277/m.172269 type:complete len:1356 (-) Transcript_82277:98-4165(-)
MALCTGWESTNLLTRSMYALLFLLLLSLAPAAAQEYTLTASEWSTCSQTSCNEMGSQTRTLTCLNAWNTKVAMSNCQDCSDMDWKDSFGYNCETYANDKLCTSDGGEGSGWNSNWGSLSDFAKDGKDATDACCACGGGSLASPGATRRSCIDPSICTSTSSTTTTTTTTQTIAETYSWIISAWSSCAQDVCTKMGTQSRTVSCVSSVNGSAVSSSLCEVCEDTIANWRDADGYTCSTYVLNNWCTASGGYGAGWSPDWGLFTDFVYTSSYGTAVQSCCACGGGAVEDVSSIQTTQSCTDTSKCTTFTTTTSTTTVTTTTTLEFLWQTTAWTDCYQPSCSAVGTQNRTLYCVGYDGADLSGAVTVDSSYCESQASCIETPANFRDKDGDNCATYVKNKWCADDGYGSNWDSSWGTFAAFTNKQGYNAGDSCCGCGGGTRLGVTKPTELNRICYDSPRCTSSTTTTVSSTTTTTTTSSTTTFTTTYTGSTSTSTVTTKTSTTTSSRLISWVLSDWTTCRQPDCGTLGSQARSVACSDQMGISYSLSRCQDTCTDLEEWMDMQGRSCEDYRLGGLCTADGKMGNGWGDIITSFEVYRNDGYTAPEVCCACGGGRKPFVPISEKSCVLDTCRPTFVLGDWRVCSQENCSVAGTQTQNLLCEDVAGETVAVSECEAYATCTTTYSDWIDKDGFSCEDYEDYAWCTIYGEVGSRWTSRSNSSIESFGVDGVSAFDACCQCGGGGHNKPDVSTQSCQVSSCVVDTAGTVVGLSNMLTTVTISSQTVTDYSFSLIRSLASVLETSADQLSVTDVAAASISSTANAYDVTWMVLQDELATDKQALNFLVSDPSNLQSTLLRIAKAIGQSTTSLTVHALSAPTISNMSVAWRASNWTDCEVDTSGYGITGCITQYLTGAYTRSVECIDAATLVAIDSAYCELTSDTPISTEACEVPASEIPTCTRIDSTETNEVVSVKGSMKLSLASERRLAEADVDSEAFKLAVRTSIANSLGVDVTEVVLSEYTADDDSVDVTFKIVFLATDSAVAANASSAWSSFNGSEWVDAQLTPVLEDSNISATVSATLAAATVSDPVTAAAIFSGWATCDCSGITTRSVWCTDASTSAVIDSDLCSFDSTAITEKTCIMPDTCSTSTTRTTTVSTTLARKTTAPVIVRVTEEEESNAANAVIAVIAASAALVMIACCGCLLRTLHRTGNVPLRRKKAENASLTGAAAPVGGIAGPGQPQQQRADTLGSEDVLVGVGEGVGRHQPRALATRASGGAGQGFHVEAEAVPQDQSPGVDASDINFDGQVAQPRQTSHVSEWAASSRAPVEGGEDWSQVAALVRNQTNDSRMVEVQGRPNLNL